MQIVFATSPLVCAGLSNEALRFGLGRGDAVRSLPSEACGMRRPYCQACLTIKVIRLSIRQARNTRPSA
jgi:hypothetical protein